MSTPPSPVPASWAPPSSVPASPGPASLSRLKAFHTSGYREVAETARAFVSVRALTTAEQQALVRTVCSAVADLAAVDNAIAAARVGAILTTRVRRFVAVVLAVVAVFAVLDDAVSARLLRT